MRPQRACSTESTCGKKKAECAVFHKPTALDPFTPTFFPKSLACRLARCLRIMASWTLSWTYLIWWQMARCGGGCLVFLSAESLTFHISNLQGIHESLGEGSKKLAASPFLFDFVTWTLISNLQRCDLTYVLRNKFLHSSPVFFFVQVAWGRICWSWRTRWKPLEAGGWRTASKLGHMRKNGGKSCQHMALSFQAALISTHYFSCIFPTLKLKPRFTLPKSRSLDGHTVTIAVMLPHEILASLFQSGYIDKMGSTEEPRLTSRESG